MIFTIDFYWARITKEIELPIKIFQRTKFLFIGGISALISWVIVREISHFSNLSNLSVLVINWSAIAAVALLKYILFIHFI